MKLTFPYNIYIMWKDNLTTTKQHYIDWWNHRGIVLNMWEHFQEGVAPHADIPMPAEPKDLNQKWFDPKWRADYLDWYVSHSSLKADMLPVANTQLGPGSMAAILGGVFEGGPDTIWIHPDPNFKDDFQFDPNHPNYLLHKELLKTVKAKAKGNYFVGMPDLMEGLDVLAAMKGTDKVLLDTVMQPEVLEEQVQRINDIYFQVYDELYDIIKEDNGEMAFCYFSSWAPGKMTKLQSDISTMISVEDYRRFVQPYIRQQCQKIDYTLYHLDGVGAMHHLPALLEIEELNAIQWTPGVGEPQGGSPKWYDLYRKILDGGKSIMACWVTLDELRPLLDNIGGDGVHLEMDFHNEDEVEKAMRIVEEYQTRPLQTSPQGEESISIGSNNKAKTPDERVNEIIEQVENAFAQPEYASPRHSWRGSTASLREIAASRILLLDGGMGTMVQATLPDYKGNSDLLNIHKPEVIREIHRRYLEAGSDIITANTFSSQQISMKEYGYTDRIKELNTAGVRIAREIADEYTAFNRLKPRFVAASVGPTTKMASVEGNGTYVALREAYQEQIEALIEAGADAILIETIFDMENADAACEAAKAAMEKLGKQVEIMLSMTIANAAGKTMAGHSIDDLVRLADKYDVLSVGFNCSFGAEQMVPFARELASKTSRLVSVHPNAGLPDNTGRYNQSPDILARQIWTLIENHQLNIVGGCCGTNDQHIRYLARLVEPMPGLYTSPKANEKISLPIIKQNPYIKQNPLNDLKTLKTIRPLPTSPQGGEDSRLSNGPVLPTVGSSSLPVEGLGEISTSVFDAIVAGKAPDAEAATKAAVDAGADPKSLIDSEMIRAMSEVGKRFSEGKAFVPQLLMAGRAMKAALAVLKPLMAGQATSSKGKVLIGTVKGDLHDIGKNLVASMLEGCGFEVVNIGIDVDADTFISSINDHNPDILCMSALLTTTMTYMKDVIDALVAAGLRDKVKIMVGGAPVSENYAKEIGADGYSDDANSAVALAERLMKELQ